MVKMVLLLLQLAAYFSSAFAVEYTLQPLCGTSLRVANENALSFQDLTHSFELKLDHSPFLLAFTPRCLEAGNPLIQGAPNFRSIGQFPIYGVAQPNLTGTKNVVDWLKNKKNIKKITWINLRQELVLTSGVETFTVSNPLHPLDNPYDPSATDANLAPTENWFSQQIQRLQNTNESLKFRLENEWVSRTEPIGVYGRELELFQKSEPALNWMRLSNPDMHSLSIPTMSKILELAKAQSGDSEAALVFNCHFGHGRTTTAMILAYLMQNSSLKTTKKTRLEWKKIPILRWLATIIPNGENALFVLDQASKDSGLVLDMTDDLIKKLGENSAPQLNRAMSRYIHLWVAASFAIDSSSNQTFDKWLAQYPALQKILAQVETLSYDVTDLQNLNPLDLKSDLQLQLADLRSKHKKKKLGSEAHNGLRSLIENRLKELQVDYRLTSAGTLEIQPSLSMSKSRLNKIALQIFEKWGAKMEVSVAHLLSAKGAYSRNKTKVYLDIESIETGEASPTLLHELRHGFFHYREKSGLASLRSGRITFSPPLRGSSVYSKGFRLEELSTHSKQLIQILGPQIHSGGTHLAFTQLANRQTTLRNFIKRAHDFFSTLETLPAETFEQKDLKIELTTETPEGVLIPVAVSFDQAVTQQTIQEFLSLLHVMQSLLDEADQELLNLLKGGSDASHLDSLRSVYSKLAIMTSNF